MISAAAGMAQAIQSRYTTIGVRAHGISRALRRQTISRWQQFVDSRSVLFSPRLSYRSWLSRVEMTAPGQYSTAGLDQVMELLRRLSAREARPSSMIEHRREEKPPVVIMPRGGEPHPAAQPVARPVDRVLAQPRPIHPPATPQSSSSSDWGEPAAPGDRFAPVRMPGPFQLPAPEVNRLTNEILKAIDRKVIAHRERTGRR
jgi:hypothetical protein